MFPLNVVAAASAVGPLVQLFPINLVPVSGISPGNESVFWTCNNDGKMLTQNGNSAPEIEQYTWLLRGDPEDYEFMWQVDALNGDGQMLGNINGWFTLQFPSQSELNLTAAPLEFTSTSVNGTMMIRLAASPFTVLATAATGGSITFEP